MRREYLGVVVLLATAALVTGCGGGVQQAQPRRAAPSITGGYGYGSDVNPADVKPADQVQVVEADFYGHQALKMTNGLVTLVAVPEFGGRIMEYKIGGKPLLWVNLDEVRAAAPTAGGEMAYGKKAWRNFGGYKVWPAPQTQWQGPPDPPGSDLEGGRWTGRIVKPRGNVGEIELVSPPDKTVTGLQITRRVSLYVGTTRVRVQETFKNVSARPVEWSIWDVTQVPGSLAPDEAFTDDARVYFPINPASRFEGGYKQLIDKPSGQWRVIEGGLVEVRYKNELGKIGADSAAGWIAYVDDRHDWAYVKRFDFQPGATYPDGGCSVEVYTSPDEAYMEVEVLSPLRRLDPGGEMNFAEDWYAARVGAPIRGVLDLAAVTEPLALAARDGKTHVVGTLGVFRPARLQVLMLDKGDKPIGKPIEQQVGPVEQVNLDLPLDLPAETETVKLKLVAEGSESQLARLPVQSRAQTK